jgi:spermidine synthase
VTGGSIYGLALILSAYLLGLAFGAWLVRVRPPAGTQGALGGYAAALSVVWLFSLTASFWGLVPVLLVPAWLKLPSFGALVVFDYLVLMLLLLLVTTAFGYALPLMTAALRVSSSGSIGRLFASNTVGGVLGASVTGFVLLPRLGLHATTVGLGVLALLASVVSACLAFPGRRRALVLAALPLLAVSLVLPEPDRLIMNVGLYNRPSLYRRDFYSSPVRGRIVYQKDSLTGRIAVWEGPNGLLSFLVNGKADGSTGLSDNFTQIGSAHLAALAHPSPRRVLVIGLGSGISAGSLSLHPEVEEIHAVEIEPAQLDVARIFGGHNHDVMNNPKLRVHLDDARHFLLADGGRYDLIFSEPSNIFLSGMVNLYTRDFYRIVRKHLNPGGAFIQWVHYYQASETDVMSEIRTFQEVFPWTTFWINPFGDSFLLARDGEWRIDADGWRKRAAAPAVAADLARISLKKPFEVVGFFLWGPDDARKYAGDAAICTDDFPFLEFTSPHVRYVMLGQQEHRVRMQLFGPVGPMPLARESEALRIELGDMFYARHSLARSRAEYGQALKLNPFSKKAAGRLARP